jgi:N-acetylneuraminate synthase
MDQQLSSFIVSIDDTIQVALTKIDTNTKGFVICLDKALKCSGVLTDGDVRRYLLNLTDVELRNLPVHKVMNSDFVFKIVDENTNSFNFSKIKFVPVVDKDMRLLGINYDNENSVSIDGRHISRSSKPFVIAEVGNNHNGKIDIGYKLIECAKTAGADCVKFQHRDLDNLYKDQGVNDISADLGTQYTKNLIRKFQLGFDDLVKLFDYCKELEMIPLCTPWDIQTVDLLENYGMPAYKIASADLNNFPLFKRIKRTNKPVIVSTGMASEVEVLAAFDFLNLNKMNHILLHCNSTYPAPFSHINLKYIKKLLNLSDGPVGYSGHERGTHVSAAAIALGATVIERHITTDKNAEGADHKASLLPEEFNELIQGIQEVWQASRATHTNRVISQGEMMNRHNLSKSIVAKDIIKKGQTISEDFLLIRSPGIGLAPNRIGDLIGKRAHRNINVGDFFYETDIISEKKTYFRKTGKRPIGIPVRYHDFALLKETGNFDFVEFHLSYSDLNVKISDYIKKGGLKNFVVHAPELFADDHLLDLASQIEIYRGQSIQYLQKTIDITVEIRELLGLSNKPNVVVNMGGFSRNGFSSKHETKMGYDLIYDSLERVDHSEVTICAQTMPPFPWHFGGQQYHNLFINPEEILEFSLQSGTYICLDTSHTLMASKYFNFDFFDAVSKLSPIIKHIHLADAIGYDQEGVKLGQGELDIVRFKKMIDEKIPNVPLICETWQGHVNSGQGFLEDLAFYQAL